MRLSTTLVALILILGIFGCGAEYANHKAADSSSERYLNDNTSTMPAESEELVMSMDPSMVVPDSGNASSQDDPQIQTGKPRKIIYTASLDIVVEQFDGVESMITDLVNKHDGFIASANLNRMQGEQRHGTWTVRIPVAQYDTFLNAVGDIGVPTARTQNASDVTEEFVDLEARIQNKKKLEARIIELLERPDDKLQQVIEVERELARVREEIERMEGRIRFLKNQTSLTTVTITVREERDYVPPTAPTFASRISNAWSSSLINTKRLFENAVVFATANLIGFGVFLLVVLISIPVLRRTYRFLKRIVSGPAVE